MNATELLEAAVRLSTSLIFKAEQPTGDTPLIAAINRWREDQRFDSPEEAQTVLKDLLSKLIEQKEQALMASQDKWQTFCASIRINCFCESHDIPEAWERFADMHKGIAIAIRPDERNGLVAAQAVNYTQIRPQLTTLKEQLGALTHNSPIPITQRFPQHLLCKPDFLKTEQEWRAVITKDSSFKPSSHAHYDEKPLGSDAIEAIYCGALCPESQINSILKAAKQLPSSAKVYRMAIAKDEFQLVAEAIQ